MDITKRIASLTEETVNFADIINYTSNPDDIDMLHACELFSQYLHHQLDDIRNVNQLCDNHPEVIKATSQLYKLSELITNNLTSRQDSIQWHHHLTSFNDEINSLKSLAA